MEKALSLSASALCYEYTRSILKHSCLVFCCTVLKTTFAVRTVNCSSSLHKIKLKCKRDVSETFQHYVCFHKWVLTDPKWKKNHSPRLVKAYFTSLFLFRAVQHSRSAAFFFFLEKAFPFLLFPFPWRLLPAKWREDKPYFFKEKSLEDAGVLDSGEKLRTPTKMKMSTG